MTHGSDSISETSLVMCSVWPSSHPMRPCPGGSKFSVHHETKRDVLIVEGIRDQPSDISESSYFATRPQVVERKIPLL